MVGSLAADYDLTYPRMHSGWAVSEVGDPDQDPLTSALAKIERHLSAEPGLCIDWMTP